MPDENYLLLLVASASRLILFKIAPFIFGQAYTRAAFNPYGKPSSCLLLSSLDKSTPMPGGVKVQEFSSSRVQELFKVQGLGFKVVWAHPQDPVAPSLLIEKNGAPKELLNY